VSSLFLVQYSSTPRKSCPRLFAGPMLRICVLAALITVIWTPSTIYDSKFLPNLVVMHAFLLAPLLRTNTPSVPNDGTSDRPRTSAFASHWPLKHLYYTSALVSFIVHADTTLKVLRLPQVAGPRDFVSLLVETLFHHPAQSSISFDVACTHVIWMSWIAIDYFSSCNRKSLSTTAGVVALSLAAPIASIATVAPLYLAFREDWLDSDAGGSDGKAE
jgi:hypothetical protein